MYVPIEHSQWIPRYKDAENIWEGALLAVAFQQNDMPPWHRQGCRQQTKVTLIQCIHPFTMQH